MLSGVQKSMYENRTNRVRFCQPNFFNREMCGTGEGVLAWKDYESVELMSTKCDLKSIHPTVTDFARFRVSPTRWRYRLIEPSIIQDYQ